MRNKKAFTLVELLAVIIILGILAVLIAPKVVNMINESEKSANMTSAENLVKAAELKASNNMIDNGKALRINYQTGENENNLDYSGKKPQIGVVQIKANGEVAMAVKFGDYCYLKEYDSSDISTIPYSSETCNENAEVFINKTIPELAVTGDGLYEALGEPGRYIYRGANPNNYIILKENGDYVIYRIVSYEPDGTIKVVRNEKVLYGVEESMWDGHRYNNQNSTYCYKNDVYSCNAWGNQSNTYYNEQTLNELNQDFYFYYYEDNQTTNFSIKPNSYSGTVTEDSEINVFFNNTWINTLDFKDNIETHSFNVGGIFYDVDYTGGDKGLKKEKEEEKVYTWKGKIGLLNATEYVESSTDTNCRSVYSNYFHARDDSGNYIRNNLINGWPCKNNNFNYKNYIQWTITAGSKDNLSVWYVDDNFGTHTSSFEHSIRPTFYLKSSIKLGGLGTPEIPYYIIEN